MRDAFPRVALLLLLLSGCASQQGYVESSGGAMPVAAGPSGGGGGGFIPGAGAYIPPSVTQPPAQNYARTIQESSAGPALLSLYKQAQAARSNGHSDQAEALLERAVHIDPRNAFVWQALAGARMDLKQYDQVEGAASKSSNLARGNPYVEAGNWRLIAAARQARGDADGAVQAQARADNIARALSN